VKNEVELNPVRYFKIIPNIHNIALFVFFAVVLFGKGKGFYDAILIVAKVEIVLITILIAAIILFKSWIVVVGATLPFLVFLINIFAPDANITKISTLSKNPVWVVILNLIKVFTIQCFYLWAFYLMKEFALRETMDMVLLKSIAWKFFICFILGSIKINRKQISVEEISSKL
jgi:hypothetical protein